MRFRIALPSAALFLLGWIQLYSLQPSREYGVLPIDPPTPYIHYLPASEPKGRILVGHGLDASKEVMQNFSAALADAGFEVYAVDLPGHGDAPSAFEASRAGTALLNVYKHLGTNTTVIGHSMTAGLLLDLASSHAFSTLILLSPPPMPVASIQADRALIVVGALEPPRISGFGAIAADAAGPQVEFRQLVWAGHSTAIFHPTYIRQIIEWLGGDTRNLQIIPRFVWIGVMLVSAVAIWIALMSGPALPPANAAIPTVLVRYVVACSAAILVLKIFLPLRFVRLFATDYLVSFLFVTGLGLWIQQRPQLRFNSRPLVKALAAAAFVIVVIGFATASNLLHVSLWSGRWWRLPIIIAAGFFLLTYDEATIRRLSPRWKSAAVALISRLILWAFVLTGVLLLNREAAFLVMIAHLILIFWLILWVTTEIVHRYTRDPLAAGLYAAIVQGWAFAALFVRI